MKVALNYYVSDLGPSTVRPTQKLLAVLVMLFHIIKSYAYSRRVLDSKVFHCCIH